MSKTESLNVIANAMLCCASEGDEVRLILRPLTDRHGKTIPGAGWVAKMVSIADGRDVPLFDNDGGEELNGNGEDEHEAMSALLAVLQRHFLGD